MWHKTTQSMHHSDKFSLYSSVIWLFWLNSWVFVFKVSGGRFEFRCSHLSFRYRACFKQGIPWYSANCRVQIYFKLARSIKKTRSMYRRDKFSQYSSIIWSDWWNGWVFTWEIRCCRLESRCGYNILRS